MIDNEWVQIALGRAHARIEALTLINWKLASDADRDVALSPAEASATKIYGSELATEVYRSLIEVIGPNAGITGASDGAVLAGRVERYYRSALVITFGGGTNEIQRDIIGYVGLGLPAAKRSRSRHRMDSPSPPSRTRPPSWPPRSSRTGHQRADEGRRGRRPAVRPRPVVQLGSAGLLGLALPEEYDGAGLGLVELCRVLVEIGRTVAPVPLAAHGPAARLLAEHGSDAQKQQWLPGAASGANVLTAAVAEERDFAPDGPPRPRQRPATATD